MKIIELKEFINGEKENLVKFLSELIEIKSLPGHEEKIVNRVEEEMNKTGYDEVFTDSVGNVIGRIANGPKTILFDAHLDVVSADEEQWDTDPFKAVIKEGKIYGRGAMDDKGPFTSLLFAGRAIKELYLQDEFTIYIIGSVSEEDCEGLALGSFLREYKIKPNYVIIAEASNLKICRGHRGRALIEARFKGMPVHASIHKQGDNPIEKALPFAQSVAELDKKLASDKILGQGDIVVTNIDCKSTSLNTLPSECTVTMDRRLTTADSRESLLAEMNKLPNADCGEISFVEYKEKSYNGYLKKALEYFPAWILEEDHPLVQAAVNNYSDLFKEEPAVTVWSFCTNGNYTMGIANIPTVGFGPGIEKLAHANNEYIDIDDLLKASQFYAHLHVYLSEK